MPIETIDSDHPDTRAGYLPVTHINLSASEFGHIVRGFHFRMPVTITRAAFERITAITPDEAVGGCTRACRVTSLLRLLCQVREQSVGSFILDGARRTLTLDRDPECDDDAEVDLRVYLDREGLSGDFALGVMLVEEDQRQYPYWTDGCATSSP